MRLSFVYLFCLLLGSASLSAQTTQQVKVVEYLGKESKKPLPGVSLSVSNAPASISDEDGNITLSFRTLHDGDKVSLRRADKSGYEVFNKDAVEQWTASSKSPFRLVMCESAAFRALCEQYQSSASANYELQYKKDQEKLAQLLKNNQLKEEEYQKQLAELEQIYNEQLDNLETYVERFARIDLEELSDEQQKIVQLVQQGQFDKAIKAYEAAGYYEKFLKESQDRAKAQAAADRLKEVAENKREKQRKLFDAIENQVNAYSLAGGIENYRKIHQLLKNTADADTTFVDAVYAYYDYCHQQHLFDEGVKYGLIYARQMNTVESQILIYSEIGMMYNTGYQYEKENYYLQKSFELAEEMIKSGHASDMIKILYAENQLYFAEHYFAMNAYSQAKPSLMAAKPVLEMLYQDNPTSVKHLSRLVACRTMEAYCVSTEPDGFANSLQIIDEMLELLRPRMSEEPTLVITYSVCLSYATNICGDHRDFERAIKYAQESHEIQRKLYEQNPMQHCFNLMICDANITKYAMSIGQCDLAEQYQEEAMKLLAQFEEESQTQNDMFRFYLTCQQAHLYVCRGDDENALKAAREALGIAVDMSQLPDAVRGEKRLMEDIVERLSK